MKHNILLTIFTLIPFIGSAQNDTIIQTSGDTTVCFILTVNKYSVYYRTPPNPTTFSTPINNVTSYIWSGMTTTIPKTEE